MACALIAGSLGWYMGGRSVAGESGARTYARLRLPVINAQSRAMDPGFVLYAGDSHIDLYSQPDPLCGRPTMNAGLSGATAAVYLEAMDGFALHARASIAVLTIGTNDLIRRAVTDPVDFERAVGLILDRLSGWSDRVVATAIPPIDEQAGQAAGPDLIARYSRIIASACAHRANCSFVDPFARIRTPDRFGAAKAGATTDGTHAKSYQDLYAGLAVCGRIQPEQVGTDWSAAGRG